MKSFFIGAIVVAVIIAGCNGGEGESWPEDLQGKQALLKEKKASLSELQKEIAKLEEEINEAQPGNNGIERLVTTTQVEKKDFRHFVEIQGTVQSDDIVNVSSEIPGRIMQLNVQEGQNINSGQLIARIDIEQVDKQIAELQTSLDLANEVFERQKRLWEQKIGSEIQYLQAKNNKERLEKSLETAAYQRKKGNIYAPISGVVETVSLKAGEMASPGFPIVTILNTRKVKVVAEVPESYLTAVKEGEKVTIKFPALNKEVESRVDLVGKTINSANRTFDVEVELANTSGYLKPNLLATMLINDYTVEDAVIVPLELVQQESNGQSFVFIKAKDDKEEGAVAKKVYVETGKSYEGDIVIQKGLAGNEELIAQGARSVSDNTPIKVKE